MDAALMSPTESTALTHVELNRLLQQIGNTPMQALYVVVEDEARTVHLKLEGANPTGSAKDRTGYSLVLQKEREGVLKKGSVIVESTSGNLGVALAFISKARGYGFVAVVDPKTTQENITKMQALGAQIDMVRQPDENGGYLLTRLARIQELRRKYRHYVWTDQYSNTANPHVHYTTTGPQIYRQMHGKVGAIFVAVSTGGTLAGVGRYFREFSPATRVIGVDVCGSVIFGTPAAPRKLTGIGSSRSSSFLSPELYDSHMLVRDEEAFAFCRALYNTTGIKVGGSSGAVLSACVHYLQAYPDVSDVVCVCADDGQNYTSSIFSDSWLLQQGIHLSPAHLGPLQDIVKGTT